MSFSQSYLFEKCTNLLRGDEQRKLQALSSHIDVSASSAYVSYQYGSFKHDPLDVLVKYFDCFRFYIPDCGGRLAYRFIPELVDVKKLKSYQVENHIMIHELGEHLILEISLFPDQPAHEHDGNEFYGSNNPFSEFYTHIMRRDYRWLDILWYFAMEQSPDSQGDETLQPSLSREKLTSYHHLLANFFHQSRDVITVFETLTYCENYLAFDPEHWLDIFSRNDMMPILRTLVDDPTRAQQQLLKEIRDEGERSGDPAKLGKSISLDAINDLVEQTREQRLRQTDQ